MSLENSMGEYIGYRGYESTEERSRACYQSVTRYADEMKVDNWMAFHQLATTYADATRVENSTVCHQSQSMGGGVMLWHIDYPHAHDYLQASSPRRY
jgi:hypothetical protein